MPPRQRLLLAYAARRRRRSSRCSALAMSSPVPHCPGVGNQVPLKERVRLGEIMDSRRAVTDPGSRLDDRPEDGFTGLLTETLIGHDRRRYLPGRQAPPCPTGRHHRCQSGCHAMARTLHPVPGPLRQLRHALLTRRRPPPCPSDTALEGVTCRGRPEAPPRSAASYPDGPGVVTVPDTRAQSPRDAVSRRRAGRRPTLARKARSVEDDVVDLHSSA
jgi:hypothetical protein